LARDDQYKQLKHMIRLTLPALERYISSQSG